MPKKTSQRKATAEKPLTKTEFVNYLGPIFEELKVAITSGDNKVLEKVTSLETNLRTEIKSESTSLEGRMRMEMKSMEGRLTDKINWQGTLIEDVRKEVKTALQASSSVLDAEGTVKDHEGRISHLERDVKVLRAVKVPIT